MLHGIRLVKGVYIEARASEPANERVREESRGTLGGGGLLKRSAGAGPDCRRDTYDFEYITAQNIDVSRLLKYSRSHSDASIMPDTFQSLGENEVLSRQPDSSSSRRAWIEHGRESTIEITPGNF